MADEDLWNHPRFQNWIEVAKAYQTVRRRLGERMAAIDLDLPRYDILATVLRFEGLTQQMLADKLLVGRSNMSMLIPDMERAGLLTRQDDPSDRRVKRLHLTKRGREIAHKGLQVQGKLVHEMMNLVPQEECDALGATMRTIRRAMEETPSKVTKPANDH